MSGDSTVALSRAWFTWSNRPAEVSLLPLGLRLTPVLYSARLRRTSVIDPRQDRVRFLRHTVDSGLFELETEFADTRLTLTCGATEPFAVQGGWRADRLRRMGRAVLGHDRGLGRGGGVAL